MRLTDKNKTLTYSEENQINLARRKNGIKIKSWYYGEPIERLAEFEDFMEEQGFKSLGDLKKALGRQFEIREAPFRYGQEINGVFFSNEQIMVLNQFTEFSESWLAKYENSQAENQALKERWEKLKNFVNMPKEIQQWDERFEITVDSIKAKMQELELADLIRKEK